jgi:hypothetical protein
MSEGIDAPAAPPPASWRIVRHPSELAALSVLPLRQPRPRGRVVLWDPHVAEEERLDWEARLNRSYRACGCGEASLGLLVGLLGAGAVVGALALDGAGPGAVAAAGWVLGSAIAGNLLGKAMGLWRAEARLKRLVREITARWPHEPRPTSAEGCG